MAKSVARKITRPIEDFMKMEASSGVTLMLATIVALFWANSPYAHSYQELLHLKAGFVLGPLNLKMSLHHWINDGLMAIFFFVVGLEIKRELIEGELSNPRKATLPLFAALGGMIVPALIYVAFNLESPYIKGWGIPMATDIAFAVGILALLGKRTPLSLKIFLLALAIIDDLGAVLVIAFFYTETIVMSGLSLAFIAVAAILFLNFIGFRSRFLYGVFALIVWYGILKSGVHATIAGVILGFITPLKPLYHGQKFADKLSKSTQSIFKSLGFGEDRVVEEKARANSKDLYHLQFIAKECVSPLDQLMHNLHNWVSFFIMPLFALFNAGVALKGFSFGALAESTVAMGIILGLVVGKPLGVLLFVWLAIKMGLSSLPRGVTKVHIIGVGFLAGIGFTMALFVGDLALVGSTESNLSKLAILIGSLVSGILGAIFLLKGPSQKKEA